MWRPGSTAKDLERGLGEDRRGLEPRSWARPSHPRPVEKQCESSSGPAARSWRRISQPQVSHSNPCFPSAGPLLLLLAQSLHFFSVQLRWPEVPRLIIPKKFRNPKGDGQRQIEKKRKERSLEKPCYICLSSIKHFNVSPWDHEEVRHELVLHFTDIDTEAHQAPVHSEAGNPTSFCHRVYSQSLNPLC